MDIFNQNICMITNMNKIYVFINKWTDLSETLGRIVVKWQFTSGIK